MKLRSLSEFRVWQLLSLHQFQERIAKEELIIAIVKPMLQLIQIGVQMLHAELVVGANHSALS
jgi:hypothetical protein